MSVHFYTIDAAVRDALILGPYLDEGVACHVALGPDVAGGQVRGPLLVAVNPSTHDAWYMTNAVEFGLALANGYKPAGGAGWVCLDNFPGTVRLIGLFHPTEKDHFYTTDVAEMNFAIASLGYVMTGVVGHVFAAPTADSTPLFRLNWGFDAVFSANQLLVAGDKWSKIQRDRLTSSFASAQGIYAGAGIRLSGALSFDLPSILTLFHDTLETKAEMDDLTDEWSTPNKAIDLFVARVSSAPGSGGGLVVGLSQQGGLCDKTIKASMTGAVVTLNASFLDVNIAHELGHYLGLAHDTTAGNVMNPSSASANRAFTSQQVATMTTHCFMKKY